MRGHTDRATINARKPLSEAMATMLRRVRELEQRAEEKGSEPIIWRELTNADKNRIRALRDRGLVYQVGSTLDYILQTDAGKATEL
jgi:hypothetical protein